MKKFIKLLSIFFAIMCLVAIFSYLTPSGRYSLVAANSHLAKTGFSLWQYFWLAMVFSCIALISYICLTRHYKKKYKLDDDKDKS